MKVIVVGAGLAGLTCAKALREGGAGVTAFEASDGVGGRVRTDEKDGFLLDRGVQAYFTAYPVARRHLDHARLDLRAFDPGAIIHRGRDWPHALRRISYGQFAQPPGIHETLPKNRTATPNHFLAGEYTEDSSINGSMLSGEKAAREVLG